MAITPTNSRKTWTDFFIDTAYSMGSSAALKTQQIWEHTPQPVKTSVEAWQSASPVVRIPLKAAAICCIPGGPLVQGAATLAAIWSETPQEVVRAVTGEPINALGHRIVITGGSQIDPLNNKEPLRSLSDKIERCEAISNGQTNPQTNAAPLTAAQLEEKTNKNLETLIQKVSYYGTLYSLHSYICKIDEENSYDSLIGLVASASKLKAEGKEPSLWRIFYKKYKDRLSFPQIVKAGIFYFFSTYIPIIPNTVEAYMKNLLGVIRNRLKKDSVARNQFIRQTIANNERLLGVTNGATKKFAKGEALTAPSGEPLVTLDDQLIDALNRFIGASDEELSTQFINALIDQYPTRIPFRFGEGILNWIIPKILKKWVLPNVALSLVQEGNQQLKQNGAVPVVVADQNGVKKTEQRLRSHIPFFLALTQTLVLQMTKIKQQLEEERKKNPTIDPKSNSDDPINLIGTEGLPGFIANLIEAIHLSGPAKIPGEPRAADTIKDVASRVKKLDEEVPDELDARIKTGIQLGLVEGTHFLLNYLADPNNTEDMFAKLLGLLDNPFSREEPKTPAEWEREKNTYENSKQQLRTISKEIFQGIIDSAVEKAAGDTPPERTEAVANAIFAQHKRNGLSTFEHLQTSLTQIEGKLILHDQKWKKEQSLIVEIDEICATLKDFKNIEELEEEINKLSGAEQLSIKRVLKPIYQGADQLMESTLILQQTEMEYGPNARNNDRFDNVIIAISQIKQLLLAPPIHIQIPELKAATQKIHRELTYLEKGVKVSAQLIDELTVLNKTISEQIAALETEQTALGHIVHLKDQSSNLIAYMTNRSIRFDLRQQILEMKKNIDLLRPVLKDRDRLLNMMQRVLDWDKKSPLQDLTQPLLDELKGLETAKLEKTGHIVQEITAQNLTFEQLAKTHKEWLAKQKETNTADMNALVQQMKDRATTLHTTIISLEKESQVQLRSENSKLILATLGALLGMGASFALRPVAPSYIAPAITAFLAIALYHSAVLLTGTPQAARNAVGKMVLGASVSGGAAMAAASVLPAAVAIPIFSLLQSHWLGTAAASVVEHNIEIPKKQAKARAVAQVTEIFDKAYDNILTSSFFYEGNIRLFMRDLVRTHRV